MTEKDKKLISKAEEMDYIQHCEVYALIPFADTAEAISKLKQIAINYYRREEYSTGCF